MKHEVFWKNPGYKPRPELKEDIECDYLIVGGGITGVSTAYFLSKLGAINIVLVEKGHIASGATGKAAGTLVLRGETDLQDLYKTHKHEEAKLYWEGIHVGLRGIKRVIEEENIDCDAEPQDTLYGGYKNKTHVDLRKEYKLEKSLEDTTQFFEGEELKKELNTDLFTHVMVSRLHGLSVNPLKLTQNLSLALEKYGVRVYENTAFLGAAQNVAKTPGGKIRYKKLIIAIDADDPNDEVLTQKTTIVITRPLTKDELVKTGLIRKKIVWDTKKNYNYFKVLKDNRMLFGYGIILVHKKYRKTDPHAPHLKSIQSFIKKLFPYLNLEIEYSWSGNFGVTKDYEPIFEFNGDTVEMSGAGSQVVCFMPAEHIAHKLLGKPSPAARYFGN